MRDQVLGETGKGVEVLQIEPEALFRALLEL